MQERRRPIPVELGAPTRLGGSRGRSLDAREIRITRSEPSRHDHVGGRGMYEEPRGKRRGGWWKGGLVVLGAIMLTTLAIRASDTLDISETSFLAGAGSAKEGGPCPKDMVHVPTSAGGFCLDRYENSTGEECRFSDPQSHIESGENISQPTCIPESAKSRSPWVNITLTQAMGICARAGKRLPSAGEWYRAALGTPDALTPRPACGMGRIGASSAELSGTYQACVSSFGAFDMVGNVWEWVDAEVTNGEYDGRILPNEGFITEADINGVPTATAATATDIFSDDYFFMDNTGVRAMLRGGYFSMDAKAGVHTISATVPTSFSGNAVGFRCAK